MHAYAGQPVMANKPEGLRFVENKGQWHNDVCFKTDVPNGAFVLEKNAFKQFVFSAADLSQIHHPGGKQKGIIHGQAVKQEFVGANLNPGINGRNVSNDYLNFYQGNDPSHWTSGVRQFSSVYYADLYKGIDLLVYTHHATQLKYDFIVHAGAKPREILIRYTGADKLFLKQDGLHIQTRYGNLIEKSPVAYQVVNGERLNVPCEYVLVANELHFEFPKGYDVTKELVIDPNIVFSTYTGSTADNWGYTATYDQQGCMYVGGYVNAFAPVGSNYPTTVGAFQMNFGGGTGGNNGTGNGIAFACDMGISKFSANGSQLLYSTYIGGNDNETPHSLVVDKQNNLIIYGVSYSANYPVTSGAYSNTHNGAGDIVVTKLNATGSALLGSTFVGGSADDGINFDAQEFTSGNLKRNYGDQNRGEVNIDDAGNIYVASCTKSFNFPTTAGALQSSFGGAQDGCAFKLNSNCSQLLWSTYIGGFSDDACYSLDIGPAGTLYVSGGTMSNNFPTTAGSLHSNYQGGAYDGFLAHINATGTQLLSSTFLGTSGNDQVYFVKLDATGNVYVVGQTTGNYPVVNAQYFNNNSGQFIVKLNPALNSVFYSTKFGNGNGLPNISPTAFLVDTCENVYVAGWGTNSSSFSGFQNDMFNMPLTPDAFKTTTDGTDFYFFVISKNAQSLLYASYFGGNGAIEHVDGGTSRFDKRGVIYEAMCAGCGGNSLTPTTAGVWSPNNQSTNCNLLGLKIEFNLSGTKVEIDAQPRATGCVPLTVNFSATVSNAQSFVWYFGDGSMSLQLNPVHTYTDTGRYTVMLIGLDSSSCNISDTASLEVWVRNDSISADFLPNLQINCDSNKVSLSTANIPTSQYQWSMGDGTNYTTSSVTHQYQTPGSKLITLIVTDTTKCNLVDTFSSLVFIPPKVSAAFSQSNSYGCVPLLVNFSAPVFATATYQWNFGDGNSATQNPVTHTYTAQGNYPVTLIVKDSTSCNKADTAKAFVTAIDSSADADFQFKRTFFGCDSVLVTVWSTYQGEDAELWTFGDGSQATTDTASHMYTQAGSFTITHYITDADMICKPLDTSQIVISLLPLKISLTVPDTGGCLPFLADFTGNSVLLSTNYTWYFGDGSSDTGKTVSHLYQSVGTFNVILVAVDTNACVGADTALAQITVINDSVTAAFQLNILNACDSNLVIDLVNQSVNAVNYLWDFGDGTTSTLLNENHSYHIPGSYTVTLVVTDTNRCHPVDTVAKVVSLLPNSSVNFTANDVCFGTDVVFNNESNIHAQFVWNFGDGTTSNQYSPSHTYNQFGVYNVQLVIIDSTTCDVTDTAFASVEVFQQPIAGFKVPGDTFMFETPVTFYNNSIYYSDLFWNFGDGNTLYNDVAPVHIYQHNIGNITVCITASNPQCADTFCKNIFVSFNALVGVPNAFSPNGDGINDVVKVEGKGIVKLIFRIFNRWGEKVFETTDKNIGWDGYYKGVLQEMEVYTYSVQAELINGDIIPLKGNITLLR
jgi:gliding motility-associated-like protein